MTVAVIDIGTNSIRCDIRKRPFRDDDVVYRDKSVIRLGKTVFQTGQIDRDDQNRLFDAFAIYADAIKAQNVGHTIAVATSAMREAQNSAEICEEIRTRYGIEIELISGDREAELIARGILAYEQNLPKQTVLFDIGGGSTEFCFCDGFDVLYAESVPIGALRLQQLFLKKSPPDETNVEVVRQHVRAILNRFDQYKSRKAQLIGSSGSAKAVWRLRPELNPSEPIIPKSKLDRIVPELTRSSSAELAKIPGMELHRLEVVTAGALMLQEILEYFGADNIRVTEYSLRDGLYDEFREQGLT